MVELNQRIPNFESEDDELDIESAGHGHDHLLCRVYDAQRGTGQ